MRGRLVLNGTTEIEGGKGENSATHASLATTLTLQTLVPLAPGDTVVLQGYFRAADGYFAADQITFWGCKVGSPASLNSPSTHPARPPMTTPKRCARRPHVRDRARYDAGPRRRGRRAAGVAM
jgi:hypothetical protein